jgi:ribonuclease BN (tRNA processing enzyme)
MPPRTRTPPRHSAPAAPALRHPLQIFVTHMHGDHLNGVPGLMCLMGQDKDRDPQAPLELYGPAGLRMYVRAVMRCSYR